MSIEHFIDSDVVHLLGLPGLRLTEYEAKVLLALLIGGENTPVEISKTAQVPRSRTYNVLDSLVEKTLVEKTSDEPLKYRIALGSVERILNLVKEASNRFEAKIEKMIAIGSAGVNASISAELDSVCRNLGYRILERHGRAPQDVEIDLKTLSPAGLRVCFEVKTRPELISGDHIRKLAEIVGTECDALVLVYFGSISENIRNLIEQNGILSSSFEDAFGEKLQLLLRGFEQTRLEQTNKMNDLKKELESYNQQYVLADRMFQEVISEYDNLQKSMQETRDLKELLSSTEKMSQRSTFLLYGLRADLENLESSFAQSVRLNEELLARANRLRDDVHSSIDVFSTNVNKFQNKLAELKARRGTWFDYMLGQDPFIIAPPDNPYSMFNQEDLKKSFEDVLHMVNQTRSSVVVLLTGDYGSGKTHFMMHYALKINEKRHGNCLAVYTLARKDLFSTIGEFLTQSRIDLARSWFSAKEWPLQEAPKDIYSAVENVLKLAVFLDKQGVNQIYWFIDEMERAIVESNAASKGAKDYPLLDQIKVLIDRLQESHVSLILSCTSQEWLRIGNQYPSIASRMQRILEIWPIKTTSEVRAFIKYLIERVQMGSATKKLPEFSEEALQLILQESKGNVRKIIIMSREAYWRAIEQNLNTIDRTLLSSTIGT